MRIQITNDDGIASEGLRVLARHLRDTEHEVVVVAPARDWSGAGACLGTLRADERLPVARVEIDGAEDVAAYAVDAPPALTVVAARLGAFGDPPDLVVSGINAGLNTGRSILHSGTVGAVLTAQNFGASGLAVSVADSDPWQWDTAAAIAVELLDVLVTAPPRTALNLNVPALPGGEVAGVSWGRLAPFGAVRATVAGSADDHLQFELTATGYEPEADTDQGLVEAGYAALTTLVGVTEAWGVPDVVGDEGPVPLEHHVAPGAPLHPVHRVPDGTSPDSLRRPTLGG